MKKLIGVLTGLASILFSNISESVEFKVVPREFECAPQRFAYVDFDHNTQVVLHETNGDGLVDEVVVQYLDDKNKPYGVPVLINEGFSRMDERFGKINGKEISIKGFQAVYDNVAGRGCYN